jgi:PKD repeat protein
MKKITLPLTTFVLILLMSTIATGATIWCENFPYADGTNTSTKWSLVINNPATCDWFAVRGNQMEATDTDQYVRWVSETIDISTYTNVSLSVDISNNGNMESSDRVWVYYSLDGAYRQQFATNGVNNGNFPDITASHTGLNGDNVVIIIYIRNDRDDESHFLDNIVVRGRPEQMPPIAEFTADKTVGIGKLSVKFKNLSQNATSYLWDFGDGTTSTMKNPQPYSYEYKDCTPPMKQFTVSLKAMNQIGEDIEEKCNYITVYSPAVADFEAVARRVCSGDEVTLINKTCGAVKKWEIDWGDGTKEKGIFPIKLWTHIYTTDLPKEKFTVTLKVMGKGGCDEEIKTNYIAVHGPVITDFVADKTSGVAPMTVQFKDRSQGWVTWWCWDFGDGHKSRKRNPRHTYDCWQKHITVTLISGGPCSKGKEVKANYITVNKAVAVNFQAMPIVGAAGMAVQFTNNTGGNANRFLWEYGDGESEQFNESVMTKTNPVHVYAEEGEYTVSLKAWGQGGQEILTVPGLIYVDPYYLPLELVDAGPTTEERYSWEDVIDHDILSTNASVVAPNGDAWAVFELDTLSSIHMIRMRANDALGGAFKNNLAKDFQIWVSTINPELYLKVFEGTLTEDNAWEVFDLDTEASKIMLRIVNARGENSPIVSLCELQVFGNSNGLPTPEIAAASELLSFESLLPTEYGLSQNYPNPFNPETMISFQLPEDANVVLNICNVQGQLVNTIVNNSMKAGYHNVVWNGKDSFGNAVAGGMYIYSIKFTNEQSETFHFNKKMMLMK